MGVFRIFFAKFISLIQKSLFLNSNEALNFSIYFSKQNPFSAKQQVRH